MQTEIKIIKFLLAGRKNCTIREISKGIKSDYKITHTAMHKLLKKGVLESKKIGQSVQVSLTGKFTKEVYEAEDQRRHELMKNSDFKVLFSYLKDLKFQFIALIFGSHAKGTAGKHSDIDLMVICEKTSQKSVENKTSLLSIDIHLSVFTYEELIQMAKSREFTVVSEAMKNRVFLTGVEDYYRLIENV